MPAEHPQSESDPGSEKGFDQRLQQAIERGQRRGDRRLQDAERRKFTEEDFKRLHNDFRLRLSEHIETCLRRLPQHFPGFQFETIFGERGWGAAVKRDDIRLERGGKRSNQYSRLEMVIRPFSSYHVVDLLAKGTVRNKEVFNRTHYEPIEEADAASFIELIDLWVLEYAELFAAA